MRRIKSAPANIAAMSNNKKSDKKLAASILNKKEYILYNSDNDFKKNNIIPLKCKKNNDLKNKFIDIGDYLSDITNDIDDIPVEETTIISSIILYVSHNIFKKEKLKEFNNFLIKIIIKYIIMYYFHVYILQDDRYYLFHITDIFNLYLPDNNLLNNVVENVDKHKFIDISTINKLSEFHNNIR